MDRGAIGVVEPIVVVKRHLFSFEIRRGCRLVDALYIPARRFGIENSFQLCIMVKPGHTCIVAKESFSSCSVIMK